MGSMRSGERSVPPSMLREPDRRSCPARDSSSISLLAAPRVPVIGGCMAELAIGRGFLPAYARLQRRVQRAVDAAIGKFAEHTHAGLHLEKLTGARDPNIRTIRIDQFYRGWCSRSVRTGTRCSTSCPTTTPSPSR
ncbi:hypothetical protein GCM10029963_74650 [Micromonospora andamanensis]